MALNRRVKGDGSLFQRGTSWYFSIDLGRDPLTNRRKRHQRGGFTRRPEASRAIREALSSTARDELVDRSILTVSEFLTGWLSVQERLIAKRSTFANYRMQIQRYVIPRIGDRRLQSVTANLIDRLYGKLLESGRCDGTGGLSSRNVVAVHAVLRRAFGDAVRKGLLVTNVVDRADPPKQPRSLARPPGRLRIFNGSFVPRWGRSSTTCTSLR